jgi:PAS domain S-box-containing protein
MLEIDPRTLAQNEQMPMGNAEVEAQNAELRRQIADGAQAVAGLRESEAQLRALFEHAPEAIVVFDVDSKCFTRVNDSACRLFGRSRDELAQIGLAQLGAPIQPDGRSGPILAEAELAAAARGETRVFEWLHCNDDAREIRCRVVLVRLPSNGTTLIRGSLVDISERARSEIMLRERDGRFFTAFRNCPEPIFIVEWPSLVHVEVNEAYERDFGYSREEVLGHTSLELNLWVNAPECEAFMTQIRDDGHVRNFRAHLRRKKGHVWVGEISAETVEVGHHRELVGVVRDLSKERQGEREIGRLNVDLELRVQQRTAELQALNQELEAFSYSVSHDLRAPLRSINGFSHALLEDCGHLLTEAGKGHLDRVQQAARRMGFLIDDLMQLARVSRSEMILGDVDLTVVAQEIMQELTSSEPLRHARFAIAENLQAKGDARLLRVVLENLLGNAWKFTANRPEAQIEFGYKPGSEDIYRVQDNGAGFDMSFAHKLFGAFQRLHAAKDFSGNGIGLATVQRIIRRHGGQIWAESVVDRGAAFYFTLAAEKTVT